MRTPHINPAAASQTFSGKIRIPERIGEAPYVDWIYKGK
jgi:hypothetical protein